MPKRSTKDKRHHHQWWMVPKKDEDNQWWWGYQKVYIRILPESEKQKFLDSINLDRFKNESKDSE